jgi:DNA-binding Lrp family transcriptional regulator
MSWCDLADNVGLSVTPTLRRVRQLEDEGYITGYGAKLGEARLGHAISVFVSVTLTTSDELLSDDGRRRLSTEGGRAGFAGVPNLPGQLADACCGDGAH